MKEKNRTMHKKCCSPRYLIHKLIVDPLCRRNRVIKRELKEERKELRSEKRADRLDKFEGWFVETTENYLDWFSAHKGISWLSFPVLLLVLLSNWFYVKVLPRINARWYQSKLYRFICDVKYKKEQRLESERSLRKDAKSIERQNRRLRFALATIDSDAINFTDIFFDKTKVTKKAIRCLYWDCYIQGKDMLHSVPLALAEMTTNPALRGSLNCLGGKT